MNSRTRYLTEELALVTVVSPGETGAGVVTSAPIDLARAHRGFFLLALGAHPANSTFKLQASATSGGAYNDVAGKTIALSAADANKQAIIEVNADELDKNGGARFVRAQLTLGGTSDICLCGFVGQCRSEPCSDLNATSLKPIVR